MTSDISSILAKRKPRRAPVTLYLDGDLEGRIEELRNRIKRAKTKEAVDSQGLGSPAARLETELAQLLVERDESATEFVFQAIPREDFEELKRTHPPTEEQWERYRTQAADLPILLGLNLKAPDLDRLGMAPALLAACAVEPKMTRDEAQRLWDQLSDAEAAELFTTAWDVNQKVATRPFSGTDTATTPNSGPSSITSESEESPSLSLAEGS